MSTTVRRRVPRFDAGGFVPGAQGGLNAGGGGAGGLLGNPGSVGGTPSPASGGGGGGGHAGHAAQSAPSMPAGGVPLGPQSGGSYTPGSWSSSLPIPPPPVSNGFYAKAQGLPKATSKYGQYHAGPESNQAGSWGAATGAGTTGNPASNYGIGGPTYTPPSFVRPNTLGNYGAYHTKIGAAGKAGSAPAPTGGGFLIGSPNYGAGPGPGIGGSPFRVASGGAIPEFRHGGGFSGPGASAVDVGPQTSDYRSPAQQQHDFAQADTVGRINDYYSHQKPVQDAIQAGHDADKMNAQAAMPQPQQPQQRQQQQPQQRRAAQEATQRAHDNGLAQRLMQSGMKGTTPNVAQVPQQQSTAPQTPAQPSDSAIPDDSAGIQAGAEMGGLAKGGAIPENYAEGGAVTEKSKPKARDPRAGVKAALSYTRQKFGLNDQVFGDMASRLQGGHYFASGGPIQGVEDVAAEAHGGPGQEDLEAEDLPYKVGPRDGLEDLKGEAQGKYDDAYESGGAIPDDGDSDDNAETEVEQVAGMIPTKPAGPGGDQPNPNPFPTKTPNPPFGKKTAQNDDDQDDA